MPSQSTWSDNDNSNRNNDKRSSTLSAITNSRFNPSSQITTSNHTASPLWNRNTKFNRTSPNNGRSRTNRAINRITSNRRRLGFNKVKQTQNSKRGRLPRILYPTCPCTGSWPRNSSRIAYYLFKMSRNIWLLKLLY